MTNKITTVMIKTSKIVYGKERYMMSKYTKQDMIRMAEEEDVQFIRLQFTDMFGILKNVAITKSP